MIFSLVGALAVILVLVAWRSAEHRLSVANGQLDEILLAAKAVSDNPKLKREGIAAQLWLTDGKISDLEAKARECSDKVDALGRESARLANAAAEARNLAAGRVSAAERARTALERSASQAAPGGSCLSSELKRRWK